MKKKQGVVPRLAVVRGEHGIRITPLTNITRGETLNTGASGGNMGRKKGAVWRQQSGEEKGGPNIHPMTKCELVEGGEKKVRNEQNKRVISPYPEELIRSPPASNSGCRHLEKKKGKIPHRKRWRKGKS